MQYGLATIATVGNEFEYPPVDFGAFSLGRHTVTWLGPLGIEPTQALPLQRTATTLQSGDADGDNAPLTVGGTAVPPTNPGVFEGACAHSGLRAEH